MVKRPEMCDIDNKTAAEIILAGDYPTVMTEWARLLLDLLEREGVAADYPLLSRAVRAA